MFPGNSTDTGRATGIPRTVPGDNGPGRRDEAASGETERYVKGFLEGQSGAVREVAGWARAVAVHAVWGFEAPEDVVQATLLALVQNLRQGRFKGGNLRAYVRRITKNMCITDYRRVRARGDHVSLDESAHPPADRVSGEDVERSALLVRILERLNEGCRKIVLLAYVQGFSRKEIGMHLGISEEAARVKLFRCIKNARAMLNGLGDVDMGHA